MHACIQVHVPAIGAELGTARHQVAFSTRMAMLATYPRSGVARSYDGSSRRVGQWRGNHARLAVAVVVAWVRKPLTPALVASRAWPSGHTSSEHPPTFSALLYQAQSRRYRGHPLFVTIHKYSSKLWRSVAA
jgi:hypothetical protein